MWGSQGWNQWALQPAMFNDIPHEQIDWAELAKQWIQMKQTPPEMVQPAPPPLPPPLPPQGPSSLPPPPGHAPLIPEEFMEKRVSPPPLLKTPVPSSMQPEAFHSDRPYPNEPGLKFKKDTYQASGVVFEKYQSRENFTRPKKNAYVPKTSDNNFWSKGEWNEVTGGMEERIWNAPPQDPVTMLGKETFDYGHVRDNPPIAMQSIDYNHMSEFSYNSVYPHPVPAPETHYDQYWSQVNVAPAISPMFLKKERSSNLHVEEETNQIDAAKRKTLPAWIRDGLEKMEQERLKRLEKEREAKDSAEKAAKSAALRKDLNLNKESSLIPSKSKFESDSEEEEPEEVVHKETPPVEKSQPSPVEDLRTEEEKKQDLMMKVRRTLTEVLLSVTNTEMIAIAQDMFRKAISKAPARQLAPSTSLSSVASGLRGLASYGTESEASDLEEDVSDSEEELYLKIKEKKKLFAVKERKIIADLEEKELEEKLNAERLNNEKKFNKEHINSEKIDVFSDVNTSKISSSTISPEKQTLSTEMHTKPENIKEKSDETPTEILEKKNSKATTKDESDSSSSSSDSESESSEKQKKKVSKESKKSKTETKRDSKKDKKSSKRDSHRKRSMSKDSDSSGKHRRERSRDRKSKKKKSKRSSSSSSDSSHRKSRRSSKYEPSRNHKDSRNKSHDDKEKKRKRSSSPSRSHRKSDGHSSRSSKHEEEKHSRRRKEEKRHREYRRSASPHRSSLSKVPRKYRSSRSLSSESESSGKKSKKSRNR